MQSAAGALTCIMLQLLSCRKHSCCGCQALHASSGFSVFELRRHTSISSRQQLLQQIFLAVAVCYAQEALGILKHGSSRHEAGRTRQWRARYQPNC